MDEGDASTTRGDKYFGDNYHFNETLFDQASTPHLVSINLVLRRSDDPAQLTATSKQYGAGKYNQTVAAEVRWNRIQDSIARNPNFTFVTPRIFTAYAESAFPYLYFVDGRSTLDGSKPQLNLTVARGFFQDGKFPEDFWRRNGSAGRTAIGDEIDVLTKVHPIAAGNNQGAGNYVVDPTDPGLPGGVSDS